MIPRLAALIASFPCLGIGSRWACDELPDLRALVRNREAPEGTRAAARFVLDVATRRPINGATPSAFSLLDGEPFRDWMADPWHPTSEEAIAEQSAAIEAVAHAAAGALDDAEPAGGESHPGDVFIGAEAMADLRDARARWSDAGDVLLAAMAAENLAARRNGGVP